MIRPEKLAALKELMLTLNIREHDLTEKFIRGSGNGGQKINKTNNCVYIRHIPSGIGVKCQISRSREDNRFFARRELCEAYQQVQLGLRTVKTQAIEKMRKQKRTKARKQKKKRISLTD